MNVAAVNLQKFGKGQPVSRLEDPRLLRGEGRYTDDLSLPNQAHAVVVRATVAHGEIRAIDTAPALALPGVVAVYTGADLEAAGYGTIPCTLPLKSHDGRPLFVPQRRGLALGRVRHVGEPVAMVVAESEAAALDGAEAVTVDIDPLPVLRDTVQSLSPGAIALWEEAPANICLDWKGGDWDAVERAMAEAAHVTRLELVNNRVVVAAMEPRAALADYDAESGRFTLYTGTQGVFGMRQTLANAILKVPPEQVRVVTRDVGGSFGMKATVYPEYIGLLHAARALGRPVKWCDPRTGSFLSDHHGRDSRVEAALALDGDGNFLAARFVSIANVGAYVGSVGPLMSSVNLLKNSGSVYRTGAIAVHSRCVFTNSTYVGAYRGAGRPEANYYMERLVDAAARETGRDPAELRRRNLVPASAMPYRSASGQHYDSGDFPRIFDAALARADWRGFAERKAASAARGRFRGRGLVCYLEVTAPPSKEMGGLAFEHDGSVSVTTGTLDYGQGHTTAFAQILADELGLAPEVIRLRQGDSELLQAGGGTGGSRSTMTSGKALVAAAAEVVAKGRALAAHVLEAAPADIEFEAGAFRIAGTDRAISLMDLAAEARRAESLPEGVPASLDTALVVEDPPSSFPNGCHVCEVEIDPETGAVEIARYLAVDDFGTIINPLLVAGQVQGGVTQGIGQALMEHAVYDEAGQLLAGSFMDYALPRADQAPGVELTTIPVPATTNPLGVKGCGEAGITGALPAVMNAVIDALAERGITHLDMPATPERIWSALDGGARSAPLEALKGNPSHVRAS